METTKDGDYQMTKPEYIIIHHSATTQGDLATLKRYHVENNGWKDIGYHYVIGNGTYSGDGELEKGRSESVAGAHAKDWNNKSIGVCLVGNFEKNKPTDRQIKTLIPLIQDIMKRYNIPIDKVIRHKDVNATSCPGMLFNIQEIRNMLKKDYMGHWAEKEIKKTIKKGLMLGYADGSWMPEKAITRAEMAIILNRLKLLD